MAKDIVYVTAGLDNPPPRVEVQERPGFTLTCDKCSSEANLNIHSKRGEVYKIAIKCTKCDNYDVVHPRGDNPSVSGPPPRPE